MSSDSFSSSEVNLPDSEALGSVVAIGNGKDPARCSGLIDPGDKAVGLSAKELNDASAAAIKQSSVPRPGPPGQSGTDSQGAGSFPLVGPPLSGPPVSGPPLSRPPLSGPPVSGLPLSRPPLAGPPVSGPPLSRPPLAGPPVSGPPLTVPPLAEQSAVSPRATMLGLGTSADAFASFETGPALAQAKAEQLSVGTVRQVSSLPVLSPAGLSVTPAQVPSQQDSSLLEEDADDAPTTAFVHSSQVDYDPDAAQDGNWDEYEPPTAIHTSAFKGDTFSSGPGASAGIANFVPWSTPQAPKPMIPAAGTPVVGGSYDPYAASVDQPLMREGGAVSSSADFHGRRGITKEILLEELYQQGQRDHQGESSRQSSAFDSEAAPIWLEVLALGTVISAVTVLCVLGWLLGGTLF